MIIVVKLIIIFILFALSRKSIWFYLWRVLFIIAINNQILEVIFQCFNLVCSVLVLGFSKLSHILDRISFILIQETSLAESTVASFMLFTWSKIIIIRISSSCCWFFFEHNLWLFQSNTYFGRSGLIGGLSGGFQVFLVSLLHVWNIWIIR